MQKTYAPLNLSRFVFLCGANKSKDEISERRKALIEFSQRHLPDTHFFLAEKMFYTLKEEGHKGNILDVEHLISAFSDFILIILESPSSFAELGAFSHDTLRSKLIVINDEKFRTEKSFINLGPMKAIEESGGSKRILHYRMRDNGVHTRDAIGDTFHEIHKIFKDPIRSTRKPMDLDALNPAIRFDKYSAMFLHDLIYLSGPVLHKEIIEILKIVFGASAFNNTAHLLAILNSFGSVERNKKGLYRSTQKKSYYEYRFDVFKIIATFRNYTIRNHPERLYEY